MIVEKGKHYLYRHVRLDKNEPFYIGVGTKGKRKAYKDSAVYKRAFDTYKRRGKIWGDIAKKSEWKIEILLESDDYDFIKKKEIEFIALYGRINLGTGVLANLTDGGEGIKGGVVSQETKNKISKGNMGRIKTLKEIELIRKNTSIAVYNVKTNQIFDSSVKAAEFENISYPVFYYRLHSEIMDFDYKFVNESLNPIKRKPKIGSVGKKIQNTETGEIFDTITKAAECEGISRIELYNKLRYKQKYFKYKRI